MPVKFPSVLSHRRQQNGVRYSFGRINRRKQPYLLAVAAARFLRYLLVERRVSRNN